MGEKNVETKTMKERIANGKLFTDNCEGMQEERRQGKRNMIALNATGPDDMEERLQLMKQTFGSCGFAWLEPPIYFCYGKHIELGEGVYINVNCSFIDDAKISIGDKVMFGPNVTIATVSHPIRPDMRVYMYCNPVTIEENCWIGAGSTICPGVTIGKNSVIGAGSVVTKDIPPDSVAVGNPCRVIRQIDQHDMEFYNKDIPFTKEDLEEEARYRNNQ